MEPGPLKKGEEEAKGEDDSIQQEQPLRPKLGRPRKRDRSRMIKVGGSKSKLESKLSGLKCRRMNEHSIIHYDTEPLRRSKREKRLMFATLNVAQIDKQILNPGPTNEDLYLTDDELDPYEKLLSPCRNTRRSARLNRNNTPSNEKLCTGDWTKKDQIVIKEEKDAEGGEEEEVREVEGVEEVEDASEEEDDEDGEEEEEEAGYYNLRKRQPVIYHIQPLQRSCSPPNKSGRKRRRSRHSSFHSNSLAYQTSQTSCRIDKNSRKRQAHRDSSTTSSDTDSDEARFRRRKGRSMAKSRMQCLPMNFMPEDISHGVLRDRIRVGASLADINPMNIDQSVTFDSIGGLKSHIRTLKEMIIFPFLYPEVFERFQIKPPRGVLFHGPPGCGKTLVARVLANECSKGGKKVAFFMRKGADCLSKWVGESERQLRLLFDQAYQYRPSIIFFDEIDGLAPIRSSRQDQIHSSIVSTLLALMDGLDSRGEIVVIGATNRIDAIDPALRRPGRFDRELIFPLPSREDRRSILTIHTRAWNPKLKSRFLSELADRTVGYCGADLSALCTEAALFALRRRYPQIYNTTEKLVLDTTQIQISSADFQNALKAIVPTAQRSDSSMARALPSHIQVLFLSSLKSLLSLVCFVFPPSWKAVKNASAHVDALLKMELAFFSKIDQRVEELKTPVQNANFQINCGNEAIDSTFQSSSALSDPPRRRRTPVRKTTSRRGSLSNSVGENSFFGEEASLLDESQGPDRASCPRSIDCSLLAKKKQARMEISLPLSFTHLHQRQQAHCIDLGKVFFDLTELSSVNLDVSGKYYREESILEECQYNDGRSSSERRSTSRTPSVDLTHYLGMLSHPHVPPAVYHPRLVLCGQAGMGQSSYLGPALIHALEDLPVKIMDLLTVFGSSTRSPEESCTQILREATRTTPSILYLPRLDSWWNATSEAFQLTLLSFFSSLPSSTPLLMLATAECQWNQLPDNLQTFFRDAGSHSFTVPTPSLKQRKQFFCRILLEKPLYPPLPKPRMLSDVPLEELPVAAPPKPRELNKEEWSKISRQREAVLRELRMFLRDATNKLLAERKLKEFAKPVDSEEVPDYLDIIRNPMDLGTVMKKIDDHCYNLPKQWITDIELISRNALEYNPEHNSESRLLRHRASALQDMAHSFLDNELSEDFEKQCEEIEETYQRFIAFHRAETPSRNSSDNGSVINTNDLNADASVTVSSDIYDAPRRSLRQLGLKPMEKGFPYYSPTKVRSSEKSSSNVREFGDGEDDSIGNGGGGSEGAESSMSIDENSNTSFQDGVQEPLPHNGNKDLVSQQIIRPWEDMLLANIDRHLNRQSSPNPEDAYENRLVKNQTASGKISPGTKSIQAYANMVTPSKQPHSSIEQVGNHTGEERIEERVSPHRKVGSNNTSRRSCSIAREHEEVNPQPHRVVINFRELVDVYKKVIKDTEDCSIEKMEQLHATFEQLVFRHRMHWDREALLMDLRLATDLFFQ